MTTLPEPLKQFLERIESYLARTGMPPTRFGEVAVSDPNFVADLRDGRQPRYSTIERIDAFMRDHPGGEAEQDGKALKLARCRQ